MRRKDREIKDREKMLEILHGCDCIRLGLCDESGMYIVPVNFGFSDANGLLTIYFHGAKEGRKADMIKKNHHICFEADRKHEVATGEKACDYSFLYQSIIGYGDCAFIEDAAEKETALNCIMKRYSGRSDWKFDKAVLERTGVMKITVTEWTCKEH